MDLTDPWNTAVRIVVDTMTTIEVNIEDEPRLLSALKFKGILANSDWAKKVADNKPPEIKT